MEYKVLITRPLPEAGLKELSSYSQIIMPERGGQFSAEELLELAPEVDGVIAVRAAIDRDFIARAKRLKVISVYGAGYDNVDLEEASQRRIPVTNLPDAVTESTAEFAFALMLALSRRIIEADHFVRVENDGNWHPFLLLSNELFAKKIGIIGMGRIGQAVARRALSFGMDVYYYNRTKKDLPREYQYLSLESLLEEVDYISLHLPYNQATHHLIGRQELVKMKKTAFLINTSRGGVVDQEELIKALVQQEIAGAALDVFETEPAVPERLTSLSNVVLAPHLGTTTVETKTRMARLAAEKVIRVLSGEIPSNIVNSYNID